MYFSSSRPCDSFLSTVPWKVLDSRACLPMLLCPPASHAKPSLLQPTAPNSGGSVGWRALQAVQSFRCTTGPCNTPQSFRKFDKLECVFRFLNSEAFQSKGDLAVSSRWSQMVLLFCVWQGHSCHWTTAVYRVCEGEYAENVHVSGLLLAPLGKESSLACKVPM